MQHDTLTQQIRHQCRACHNICFTPDGGPPEPAEGYRCEGCEAAGYERYDFDKSQPRPEPPLDAGSAEGASLAAEPEAAPGASPSQDPAENAGSEARPSAEPKSADAENGEAPVEQAAQPQTVAVGPVAE
jgi:hypothetical protein